MSDFSLKVVFTPDFGLPSVTLLETIYMNNFKGIRTRLARDKSNESKYYSLKIIRKFDLSKNSRLEQVKQSLFVQTHLRCVFLVDLLAFFQDTACLYFLYDFLGAGELYSLLRAKGTFTSVEAHFYVLEVTSALLSIQLNNVVLRALTSESIYLTNEGHIRLVDLDLAKVVDSRTYTMCGTPEYIAVEVLRGNGYGMGVDWWALGVLLYELLSGTTPFRADTIYRIYQNIEKRTIQFPRTFSKDEVAVINEFLAENESKRLGVMGGESALKAHRYFNDVDWYAVDKELLVPIIKPHVGGAGDTCNYDLYPEENTGFETAICLTSQERDGFEDLDAILGRNVL